MPESHDVVWTPEKIAETWDWFSQGEPERYFSIHSGAAIAERLEHEVGLRGKRLLDFGCGRGDLLATLYAHGIAAQGLEFSEESARTTSDRFVGEPLFQGVAASPSELADGSFDVILLVEVIEHLLDEQIPPTLAEVRRLLAPGGRVVVTCPNDENLANETTRCPDCGAVYHRWQHMRSLNPASISALFEAHGFRTVQATGVYWGLTRAIRFRLRARRPFTPLPAPHLLYVGASSDSST
jgi:2-polyprenyl-3-methyl-5-hydroxy-6-metoxy-1,4-benzoquinol methylase